MTDKLRRVLNGYNGKVSLCNKPVYHRFNIWHDLTIQELGIQLNKNEWIQGKVPDPEKAPEVVEMLKDWDLYENGWLIERSDNHDLSRYLAQIGNYGLFRPDALDYIEPLQVASNIKNAWEEQ